MTTHDSDCAVNDSHFYKSGPCTCGVEQAGEARHNTPGPDALVHLDTILSSEWFGGWGYYDSGSMGGSWHDVNEIAIIIQEYRDLLEAVPAQAEEAGHTLGWKCIFELRRWVEVLEYLEATDETAAERDRLKVEFIAAEKLMNIHEANWRDAEAECTALKERNAALVIEVEEAIREFEVIERGAADNSRDGNARRLETQMEWLRATAELAQNSLRAARAGEA